MLRSPTTSDSSPKSGTLIVALAGNPNSGKTTIFNALTGLRQKVANYPGVTVEKKTGKCKLPDDRIINIIDLPGTYSLISRSPDEMIAMQVLRGLRSDTPAPDVVIVVVDASNLQRNLYLVSQIIELGRPMIVALNMTDVAERRGLRVEAERLQTELGVPVIPLVGHKHRGVDALKRALSNARVAPMPNWPLPHEMKEELLLVGGGLAIIDSRKSEPLVEKTELGSAAPRRAWICGDDQNRRLDRYEAMAERLLIGDRAGDLDQMARRDPISLLLKSSTDRLAAVGIDPMQADIEAHYKWIEGVVHRTMMPLNALPAGDDSDTQVLSYSGPTTVTTPLTERLDRIFVHKVWGLLIFAGIMGVLFVSLFWLAKPIMDWISEGTKTLGVFTTAKMSAGPVRELIREGIFAGVGAVVVFVPQIALLFMFLAILEDSGYLARAAFLMDRLLARVGLHGKSFIPLLSSFACAIPGIMATRTIENRKDRLATIFVAPFMSCSARLPVYTLLIGTIFATSAAITKAGLMLALYALGIVAAAGTAWIFKRSLLRGGASAFILEMPSYKLPQISQIVRQVWVNTKAFLLKAGTTIFCLSVILWAMTYYPRLSPATVTEMTKTGEAEFNAADAKYQAAPKSDVASDSEKPVVENFVDHPIAAAQREHSVAGILGHAMEPAIRPLGFDWKIGVGLVGAFAAREVFVSTMAITYGAGESEETDALAQAMKHDHYANGKAVWTPAVALSLLVWFVLAMQCISTFAIVRRETASWRWPIFMLVYMNALAYVASLVVYQVGRVWLG